jgi:predicted dinucleotide-binding enzyme
LAGKILVEITNPVAPDLKSFVTPEDSFGAQEIAKAAPADAVIVKAFNTQSSRGLAGGSFECHPLDVFLAGDGAQAKARVSAFLESLESLGLRPMDGCRAAGNGTDAGARLPAVAGPNDPLHQGHQFQDRRQHSRLSFTQHHFTQGFSNMHVFVTGGTGHSGPYVISDLIAAGHEVTALARSDAAAAAVSVLGAKVRHGSLEDLDGLKEAAVASDGVIHVAHRQDLIPTGGINAVAAAELQIVLAPASFRC